MSPRNNGEAVGILLLAYGSPETLDDVEPYFTHIRGGRPPSSEAVVGLKARYRAVGGRTPLLRITREVRHALDRLLNSRAGEPRYRVYFAMKHWHPFTADVMRQMAADGIRRVIALPLAPHFSRISIGGYRNGVDSAQTALGYPFEIEFVESWHLQPELLELITGSVRRALGEFPDSAEVVTVFTAHSLPERIREWQDPYESHVRETAAAVAARAHLAEWTVGWQSAGSTGEPWIGPDILDVLRTLAAGGTRHVLQAPIGFVSDHLEILFDIDIEARAEAERLGLGFARTELPNASPAFVRTLAAVIRKAESARERAECRA